MSDALLQEGKGLVCQISNLKAAAVQKDKFIGTIEGNNEGNEGYLDTVRGTVGGAVDSQASGSIGLALERTRAGQCTPTTGQCYGWGLKI